jgi:hypothetical protein
MFTLRDADLPLGGGQIRAAPGRLEVADILLAPIGEIN